VTRLLPGQGEMVLQSHVTIANIRTLSLRRGKQKICNPDFLLFRKGDSVIHGNNALLEIFVWEPMKINVKTSHFELETIIDHYSSVLTVAVYKNFSMFLTLKVRE
jgi:hypothetical protein